ncbi:MAG TPA: hypothetical protein VLA49_13905, partial [Anaerolineales bacterium]|nr:hypothetical protein [Anaerolineales bacterium]
NARICESGSLNLMQAGGIDAKLKTRLPKSSPFEVKMLVEFIRRGFSEILTFDNKSGVISRTIRECLWRIGSRKMGLCCDGVQGIA